MNQKARNDMDKALKEHMHYAYTLALKAQELDEVPIGCIILSPDGTLVSEAHNATETTQDPSAHAEVVAIRRACKKLNQKRLYECSLVTTLEPCPMCADLISKARIKTVYIGALDPKGGGLFQGPEMYTHATCYHKPALNCDYMQPEYGQILSEFFQKKRGA